MMEMFLAVPKKESKTLLMNLEGLTSDDLSWLVCRVAVASYLCLDDDDVSKYNEVFRGIIREDGEGTCQLKTLQRFTITEIFLVDSQLLAGAVTKIKSVDLGELDLTRSQATAIFQGIQSEVKLELEDLNIRSTYLRETEDDILAGAVLRLKTVNLNGTQLTTSQATAIF